MEESPNSALLENPKTQTTVASSGHNTGAQNRGGDSSRDFVEELESGILDLNNKLHIKECHPCPSPIPEPFSSSGYEISAIFDILDEKSLPVLKLARCVPKDKTLNFIISHSTGFGVLSITKTSGYSPIPCYAVSGDGLLAFEQVVTPCGYTLQDPYKKLLRIKTGWIPFFTFLLFLPNPATMKLVNLDGTPTGTFVYKRESSSSTLSIEYIRGLDRKAKYMVLASVLLPLSTYFSEPGRTKSTIILIIYYLLVLIAVGLIIWLSLTVTS